MKITLGTPCSFKQMGRRGNQEDSRYPDEDRPKGCAPFFLVCDGVGGCEKGEVASNTVCQAIAQALEGTDWRQEFSGNDFGAVLNHAYKALDRMADDSNRDMATTLTFVCFHAGGCLAAHIGDSRIYHVRPGAGILYRSDDHSLVNALVHSGNITPEEAFSHPRSNVITRSISVTDGREKRAGATVMQIDDIRTGDYFFLCTDGVLEGVTDEALVSVLSSSLSDEEKLNRLAGLCRESHDNHTAYLIPVVSVEGEEASEPVETAGVSSASGEGKKTDLFSRRQEQAREVTAADTGKPMDRVAAFIRNLFKQV